MNGLFMTVRQIRNARGEHMTDNEKAELFDLLDDLAQKDKDNLKAYHSKVNINKLKKLAIELSDQMSIPDEITEAEFADRVYELRQIKQKWSRILGDTLITAAENENHGDLNSAISILNEFIEDCPSLFYRGIAGTQINNYKK